MQWWELLDTFCQPQGEGGGWLGQKEFFPVDPLLNSRLAEDLSDAPLQKEFENSFSAMVSLDAVPQKVPSWWLIACFLYGYIVGTPFFKTSSNCCLVRVFNALELSSTTVAIGLLVFDAVSPSGSTLWSRWYMLVAPFLTFTPNWMTFGREDWKNSWKWG